jgi:hypothetical protein
MNTFAVSGLTIQSEIPLPEAPETTATPQVIVRLGKVEKPLGYPDAERAYAITREEFRVFWRGVGTFSIRRGREVTIEPDPGIEESILRLYLLGPALGILLHQQGHLVLHASVVNVDGVVVGFLGEKGWGKSTTAAALNARGHALLADDVLAVRPHPHRAPMVEPGLPQFKLWPEAAVASFGYDPTTLVRLHSGVEKRIRCANAATATAAQPLRHLYLLDRGTALESIPMTASEGLMALVRHSYLSHHLEPMGGVQDNFRQCAQVGQHVRLRRLRRPKSLGGLGEIVSLIETEVSRARAGTERTSAAVLS